ncbi:MAG TPA: hypothetical protein VHJ57_03820, partial [Nitrososphaeraceae archaeon]|nr:hypothetical protein [Nitrososphaeraceae archaeon]
MTIKIDDFELGKVIGDSSTGIKNEVRSVNVIKLGNKKRINYIPIASSYDKVTGNIGRFPVRIVVQGDIIGENAQDSVTMLRSKYKNNKPCNFVSDLSVLWGIEKVIIEELRISNFSKFPQCFAYEMKLLEFNEPNSEAQQIQEEAKQQLAKAEDLAKQQLAKAEDLAKQQLGKVEAMVKKTQDLAKQQLGKVEAMVNKIQEEAKQQLGKVEAMVNKIQEEAKQQLGKVEEEAKKIQEEAKQQLGKVEEEAKKIQEDAKQQLGKAEEEAKQQLG